MAIWVCPYCEHELYGDDIITDGRAIAHLPPNGMRIMTRGKCPSCGHTLVGTWHVENIEKEE